MASSYEEILQSILNEYITPLLKMEYFVRNRNLYYCRQNELTWVIEMKRSIFNNCKEAKFTLEYGIYIPGIVSRYLGMNDPVHPTCVDCTLYSRIGNLADDHLDKWWVLTNTEDKSKMKNEIGTDISDRMIRDGLPFLHRFRTREEVLIFLSNPRDNRDKKIEPREGSIAWIYTSILALLLGNTERSHILWDKALQSAAKGPESFLSKMPIIHERIYGENGATS